jgi:hypothetical protein
MPQPAALALEAANNIVNITNPTGALRNNVLQNDGKNLVTVRFILRLLSESVDSGSSYRAPTNVCAMQTE